MEVFGRCNNQDRAGELSDTIGGKSDGPESVKALAPLVVGGLFENTAIASVGHPLRAGQMARPASSRAGLVVRGIAMKDDLRDFLPVSPVGLGVEQAHVSYEMRLVVECDVGAGRRLVFHVGVEFWLNAHDAILSSRARFIHTMWRQQYCRIAV